MSLGALTTTSHSVGSSHGEFALIRRLHPVVIDQLTPQDLSSDDLFGAVKAGLRSPGIVLLRGLGGANEDDLTRFMSRFGEILNPAQPSSQEGNGVDVLSALKETPGREAGIARWHLDFCFLNSPAKDTALFCIEPSEYDIQTHFASLYELRNSIPPLLREELKEKKALYSYDAADVEKLSDDPSLCDGLVAALHPVLFVHPTHHKEVLYFCDLKLRKIFDVAPETEAEIRALVRSYLDNEGHRYSHSWSRGDMLVFDSLGIIHRRDLVPADTFRLLKGIFTRFDLPS